MSAELKPCRRCGGEPYNAGLTIVCKNCGIRTRSYAATMGEYQREAEAAISDWNRDWTTGAPPETDAPLLTSEILALERRSNMSDDEALRYARSVASAIMRRDALPRHIVDAAERANLTDEQCDEFRRLPGSFNDMVRAIYLAGREDAPVDRVARIKQLNEEIAAHLAEDAKVDTIESEEFYNLMQAYRWSEHHGNPAPTVEAYQSVIDYVDTYFGRLLGGVKR